MENKNYRKLFQPSVENFLAPTTGHDGIAKPPALPSTEQPSLVHPNQNLQTQALNQIVAAQTTSANTDPSMSPLTRVVAAETRAVEDVAQGELETTGAFPA